MIRWGVKSMASEAANATIGMVRQAAWAYYQATGRKLSFREAAQQARARGAAAAENPQPPGGFLPLEAFWAYIDGIPLLRMDGAPPPPRAFPDYFGRFYIREENMFMADDDITAYIHVPYIFDGIHTHDHFEINYVYHGSCVLCFADRQETLGEGAFFILAPDSPHNVYTEENSLVISVMVRKSTFESVFSPLLKLDNQLSSFFKEAIYLKDYRGCTLVGTYKTREIQAYMQSLMAEYYKTDCYHNITAISILTLAITQIMRNQPDYSFRFDFSDSPSGNFNFTVLIQYIRQNFSSVTLPMLSGMFHYSESYLSKLIYRNTGKHFGRIVREMKMERARELLEGSRLSIEAISGQVGYESYHQFSRAFKQYYGIPPLSCRRQSRDSKAPQSME